MSNLISYLWSLPLLVSLRGHLTKSQLIRRFTSGVAWTLAGNVTLRLLSAVSTISVARILGPQAFGEFGMVRSTVMMFSTYAGLRLGATSSKFVAEFRTRQPEKAERILKLTLVTSFISCSLVAIILFVLSPYLASHSLNRPELATALSLGAILVFFLMYGNIKQSALTGFENFKAIAKVSVFRGVATLLFCIPLAYFWGIEGAISGLVIVAVLMLIQVSILLRRERINAHFPDHVPLREMREEISVLWSFALPGLLVGILTVVMMWVGRLLLTQQEFGYTELGIFEAANQWQAMVLLFPAVLTWVVLPILSETYGKKSKKEFKAAISIQVQALCLVTLPLVIFTIGFSKPLAYVYGQGFEGAEAVIPILMLSVYFYAMNQAVRQVYYGAGRPWTCFATHMGWALVYLLGCLKFIPTMGAIGFALAHLIAEAILLLIQSLYVDFVLVPMALRRHLKLFTFSLLLLGFCYIVQSNFSGGLGISIMFGLFMLGLLPIFLKLKEMKNIRKTA